MSVLIIGDIHGCYNELQTLLDKSGIGSDDRIIALGDILDKGEQPREVLNFFRSTPNASSIRGNNEQKHLDAVDNNHIPGSAQLVTRWLLGDDYAAAIDYIRSFPAYIELDEAVLAHAYYEPGKSPAEQNPDVLIGMSPGKEIMKQEYQRPWFELYDGDKPLLTGHKDYTNLQKPFVYEERVYGLDTRCVYGGSLSALLLPEWRWIHVPAECNHWEAVKSNL